MTAFDCRRASTFVFTATVALLAALALPAHAQLGVSDSGLPGYGYALKVPPGISGMAPNLSLSFSGVGINGPVGHGWSVQGISSITRCAGVQATDGAIKGVKYGI